jgi:GntR family transcriptional repressor for pyruvate dehydrogenase complex
MPDTLSPPGDPSLPVPRGVAERLQAAILAGQLKAGDKLPSQRELSQRFGVSRASLREAFSMLETLGLLRVRPGSGVFVTPAQERAPLWRFADRASARDVYEARLAIEVQACALAARRAGPGLVDRLKGAVEAMRSAHRDGDIVAMADADAIFHDAIVDGCGNPLIAAMYRSVREMMVASQQLPMARRVKLEDTLAEHEAILAAVTARDVAAAGEGMRRHIVSAASRYDLSLG